MITRQEIIALQKAGRTLAAKTVGGVQNAGEPDARYRVLDITQAGRPQVLYESRYRTVIMFLLHGLVFTAHKWPEEIHYQYNDNSMYTIEVEGYRRTQ